MNSTLSTAASGGMRVNVAYPQRGLLVAGLLWAFGAPMKRFIDKYLDWLALAFMVLLIGGFVILKKVL